jgi:hypothetical protein
MCIKTFYILPLLSGVKSKENIFFLTPVDENGSLTRFTPHGVKRVIFLMEYELIYLELAACFLYSMLISMV